MISIVIVATTARLRLLDVITSFTSNIWKLHFNNRTIEIGQQTSIPDQRVRFQHFSRSPLTHRFQFFAVLFSRTFPSICSTSIHIRCESLEFFSCLFSPSIYPFLCVESSFFLVDVVARSTCFFCSFSCRWLFWILLLYHGCEREYFILSIIYKIDVICIIAWVSGEWNRKPSQNYSISTTYVHEIVKPNIFGMEWMRWRRRQLVPTYGCCVQFLLIPAFAFLTTYQSKNPSYVELGLCLDFCIPTLRASACVCASLLLMTMFFYYDAFLPTSYSFSWERANIDFLSSFAFVSSSIHNYSLLLIDKYLQICIQFYIRYTNRYMYERRSN